MKKLCTLLIMLVTSFASYLPAAAQVVPAAGVAVDTTGLLIKLLPHLDEPIIGRTFGEDQYPAFKGGQQGLKKFLKRESHWPDRLARKVAGQVYVEFVIDELGRVRNATVVRSFHPLASVEALRLVQLLDGHFTPGKHHGQPMAVRLTLPISFGKQPVPSKKRP